MITIRADSIFMDMSTRNSIKFWIKWSLGILLIPLILLTVVLAISFLNQDRIVKELVSQVNEDFKGRLVVEGSHISPFTNFPYVSIDLEHIKIYEGKADSSDLLLNISDAYLGFDFWTIINGSFEIKSIKLDSGFLKLVQHKDGSFNITNALSGDNDSMSNDTNGDKESFHLDLKSIQLINIDLLKLNEDNNVLVEAFIDDAQASLRTSSDHTYVSLDSRFLFNLIVDNDTSFLHHKHINLHTELDFNALNNMLEISPSEVVVEKALFLMQGKIDVDNDMDLDLSFSGNKPNFDLFLAFAPEELMPILSRYDNGGRIYFDAVVNGKSINGYSPKVDVNFGCAEAFVNNTVADKEVSELFFKGHFSNGEKRDLTTMEFSIEDFSAKPEAGTFKGNLKVMNFESPDINMQVSSEFDLDFLADFLNIDNLKDVSGKISLTMNFHDIVDLNNPEKSIEKLNESYFTELKVEDLSFNSTEYPLPITQVNIDATMDGHSAEIQRLDFNVGRSDVSIKGSISDLPAILHHTDIPVDAVLDVRSSLVDFKELTGAATDTSGFDEQVKDLIIKFKFKSSARAFTESPHLPVGEFFIEQLNAQLTHYPHKLHDFSADIYVDKNNFRIIDFTGMIDQSDFHFSGKLENYDLWFAGVPRGSTKMDFDFASTLLKLEDLFSYGGENYVPQDYRHEEFRDLKLHGEADLEFDRKLLSSKVSIDKLEASMKVHPMRFEQFSGQVFIDSSKISVSNFRGKLGKSQFKMDYLHHFENDSVDITDEFKLTAPQLDFDQLFAYNPPPANEKLTPEDHEAGFNIFEVPFSNMNFQFQIGQLNYHKYLLKDFSLKGRMQTDHYLYIDTMAMKAAGGQIELKGYFNGSDPKAIYFSPEMKVEHVDLDQLLFKFENFGQDHLVSENLHGKLSGTLSGKVHMHADMVPIIDDSELHMDFRVLEGSLNNYPAFDVLSSYFTDKNLSYVRFDTLQNKLDLKNGTLSIPSMNINSTLGYFEMSGSQNVDLSMEYYLRVPWKVITRAGAQKLFGKKNEDTSEQIDEIQYRDESKRTRFLNLKIEGTPDDYKISLGKDKKSSS